MYLLLFHQLQEFYYYISNFSVMFINYHYCDAHARHSYFDRFTCLLIPEEFQLDYVHFFSLSVHMTLETNTEYIKSSLSIRYFERYDNSKQNRSTEGCSTVTT